MSDSKDTKQLDNFFSLPSSSVYSSHIHLTNVEMKALQPNVRNQRQEQYKNKTGNNSFDLDPEDEESCKIKQQHRTLKI